MNIIENLTLDEERALYGIRDTKVRNCTFAGPADGESALKECRNITVEQCNFDLRYPFWHVNGALVDQARMSEGCRAAMWYCTKFYVTHSTLKGIKAFREVDDCSLDNCIIDSKEFGWRCRNLSLQDCFLTSEYPFFQCRDMEIRGLDMHGKYSFQYCENVEIHNSYLDTKDAFWHAKNVTVYYSTLKGEYLGWYSENVRLVGCKIIGTQPLCYCKGLVLEGCTMEGCDLAFENSEVEAIVDSSIDSVKNPAGGSISAEAIGEIIQDQYQWNPGKTRILVGEPT